MVKPCIIQEMHCEVNVGAFFLSFNNINKFNFFTEKVLIDWVSQWLKNVVT
jgi:hypothetical protein